MKLIDIVEELVSEGHKITYRHRTDGGLIITSIDGKKFRSLTEGNRTARTMVVGGELSEARMTQTSFNVRKYIKLPESEKKSIDDMLKRQLRKTQRAWRENDVSRKAGRITTKKLRYYVRFEGKERAFQYLQGRERYAQGYANDENVRILIERMNRLYYADNVEQKPLYTRDIDALIEDMEQLKMEHKFKESWIEPINQIIGVSEGKPIFQKDIPQIIRDIRKIINIEA